MDYKTLENKYSKGLSILAEEFDKLLHGHYKDFDYKKGFRTELYFDLQDYPNEYICVDFYKASDWDFNKLPEHIRKTHMFLVTSQEPRTQLIIEYKIIGESLVIENIHQYYKDWCAYEGYENLIGYKINDEN